MHDPFCSRDFVLINRKQFYFLGSFNPAPKQIKSGDTTNHAQIVAIKMQTCRQFVEFSDPIPKSSKNMRTPTVLE